MNSQNTSTRRLSCLSKPQEFFCKMLGMIVFFAAMFISCSTDNLTDGPSGDVQIKFATWTDPETGKVYVNNPNRRRLDPSSGQWVEDFGKVSVSQITDWSGDVEIALWEATTGPNAHPSVSVDVDNDYACIGGGAYIDHASWGSYGALLTESRPKTGNFTGWRASSKDHIYTNIHKLTVYAIGLKLNGVSVSDLKTYYLAMTDATSGTGHNPSVTTSSSAFPTGWKVVGGGAEAIWTGTGQLLTASMPSGTKQWTAISKDHYYTDLGQVRAYAIALQEEDIPGFGDLDIEYKGGSSSYTSSGSDDANVTVSSDYVIGCAGGEATWSGYGRMLWRMYFNSGVTQVLVESKDHIVTSSGYTRAYLTQIRKRP